VALNVVELETMYLAYFGRPADPDGLAFYLAKPEMDIWAIAQAFSESPESKALYGTTFGPGVIDAIYQTLFNRSAEPDGMAYWSGEVAAGRISAAGAAYAIFMGAQNDDLRTAYRKLAVSGVFTEAIDTPQENAGYSGSAAAAMARDFIQSIDSTLPSGTLGFYVAAEVAAAIAGGSTVVESRFVADGTTITLPAGQPNLLFAAGVQAGASVNVAGLVSGSTIELAEAPAYSSPGVTAVTVHTSLASDTASDTLTFKLNPAYYEYGSADTAYEGTVSFTAYAPGIEHAKVVATATAIPLGSVASVATGWKPAYWADSIDFHAPSLKTVVVTGDNVASLSGDFPALTSVDASQLAPRVSQPYFVPSVGFIFRLDDSSTSPVALVVGSQHAGNALFGTTADNTLVGGPMADFLRGGAGSDTLTGGEGNDIFEYRASTDSGITQVDTITDFTDGDVIDLRSYAKSTISVAVVSDGMSAAARLAEIHTAGGHDIAAALDASTGLLYVDTNADGAVDLEIELSGVKTLTSAAFVLMDAS
jgi:Ca2+-binding RTX toxin-like protein